MTDSQGHESAKRSRIPTGVVNLIRRAVTTLVPGRPRLVAMLVLTCVSAVVIASGSLVIDGRRYFWLDDDQMVSMRYARNLAEGHGLVWNPGERVEGYTSLGWTLIMAAIHLLPLDDATTSLAVKIVSWLLACWTIVLTARLLRALVPRDDMALAAVLLTLALCADLVFWAANGFETTLVTAVFLWALVRILDEAEREAPRVATFGLIGLLPILRSDAYHLWAVLILVALALARNRMALGRLMCAAAVLPAAQLLFRVSYYGDWLPNAYYLKVAGIEGSFWSGAGYLKSFVEAYAAPIILAAVGVIRSRDRRLFWLAASAILTVAHVLAVGADMFPHFRFLAPWVPVLLVLAAVGCCELSPSGSPARVVLLLLMVTTTTIQNGIHGRSSLMLLSGNGVPAHGLIAGLLIRQFTGPDATVAVAAAGAVPYFSRRGAIDLLGKTDARIAHLPPHTGAPIGHGKFDIEYSLSRQPDVLVTFWPVDFGSDPESHRYAASLEGQNDYRVAILRSRLFGAEYKNQPVPLQYLLANGAVYVRSSSADAATIDRWQLPQIQPNPLYVRFGPIGAAAGVYNPE